jgi:hypothetical protein
MGKRLVYWGFFNVFCALLPLLVGVSIRVLTGTQFKWGDSPELLFFIVMVGAAALRDLSVIGEDMWDVWLVLLWVGLLLETMVGGIFYGALVLAVTIAEAATPGTSTGVVTKAADFGGKLLVWSILMAGVAVVLGALTQVLVSKIEDEAKAPDQTEASREAGVVPT